MSCIFEMDQIMRVAWMLRGWDSLRHGCSGMGCAVTSHVDVVGNGIPSLIMATLVWVYGAGMA